MISRDAMLAVVPSQPPVSSISGLLPANIVDQEVDRLLRRAIGLRMFAAPILAMMAFFVAWIDPSPWRRFVIAVVVPEVEHHLRLLGPVAAAPCPVPVIDEEGRYLGAISKSTLLEALDRAS